MERGAGGGHIQREVRQGLCRYVWDPMGITLMQWPAWFRSRMDKAGWKQFFEEPYQTSEWTYLQNQSHRMWLSSKHHDCWRTWGCAVCGGVDLNFVIFCSPSPPSSPPYLKQDYLICASLAHPKHLRSLGKQVPRLLMLQDKNLPCFEMP